MSQQMLNKVHLIIGGARSGKSSLAERYAKSSKFIGDLYRDGTSI